MSPSPVQREIAGRIVVKKRRSFGQRCLDTGSATEFIGLDQHMLGSILRLK